MANPSRCANNANASAAALRELNSEEANPSNNAPSNSGTCGMMPSPTT